MKKQVVVIHGGSVFESYDKYLEYLHEVKIDFARYVEDKKDWKAGLRSEVGELFEIVLPTMPSKMNAQYSEWKIWFDKIVPYLRDNVVLIGHSLGGIFLAKYLNENSLPISIRALFLVAAPFFDDKSQNDSLGDFKLPSDLTKLKNLDCSIFIYHSGDDLEVPVHQAEKYCKVCPQASKTILKDRGHINQDAFPELLNDLKNLA